MVSVDVKHHVYLPPDFTPALINVGSGESRFNVSLIARDRVTKTMSVALLGQLEAKEVQFPQPSSTSLLMISSGLT